MLYAIVHEEPQSVTELCNDIPMELARIISKCLQKDPAQRYQHVEDFVVDLRQLIQQSEMSTLRPHPEEQLKRKRKKTISYILFGILLTIIATILIFYVLLPKYQTASELDRKMLVVLPFENLGLAEDIYFTDGITDEITGRLGTVSSIGVISRNSAMHYAGRAWETKQVGKE